MKKKSLISRRGIYLLPNLFTTAALFSGFYAITSALNQRYETAAIAIFISLILDGLDGRVARLTNTESDFGAEYDSMADMLSFAVAPALVMYLWVLEPMGKVGLFAAFIHIAGGALRLARFNTQLETADKRYFQGLPSPAAASILAAFLWISIQYDFDASSLGYIVLPMTIMTGLLMVSNFRYHSFKDINLKEKVPFVVLLAVTLGVAVTLANPPTVLFLFFFGYAISGPIVTLNGLRQKKLDKNTADES